MILPGRSLFRRVLATGTAVFVASFLYSCSGDGTGYPYVPAPPSIEATVSGTVLYEDKEYGHLVGFTGVTSLKPVRHALVEVVDAADGAVLGTGLTNSGGGFEVAALLINGGIAYVRVVADTSTSTAPPVTVRTASGGSIYSVQGAGFASNSASIVSDISIPASGPAGGAFNILDVMTAAGQFVNGISGLTPPPLTARWSQGVATVTYFSLLTGDIIVTGGSADTDEYDDDVLWHEYGHFIADAFSTDDSPGGLHSFDQNDLDLRLSYSEGWGGYFQGAVKRWLLFDPDLSQVLSLASGTPPTHYVDTDYTGTYNSKDFGNPGGSPYLYSSNEVAVAKALLDLDLDPLYGPEAVWGVFNSIGDYLLPSEQATLEAFWDGWVDTHGATPFTNSILMGREIYYMEDSFENDGLPDNLRLLAVNDVSGEEHYLYSNSLLWDTDYVAFNATSTGDYTVETFCMRNGADTYLALLDPSKALISGQYNDDTFNAAVCGGSNFAQYSSRVTYTISTPGIYYAMVNTSQAIKPVFPPSLPYQGRYGTYTIRVTGP
jgi:hypothetical protein